MIEVNFFADWVCSKHLGLRFLKIYYESREKQFHVEDLYTSFFV